MTETSPPPDERQRGKGRGFWLRLAGSLLTVGLLAWLLSQQGWQRIVDSFLMLSPGRLALAFGLTLLSRLAVGLRWHALLRTSGERVTLGQTLRITFAGLFASNYLPTTVGGDVVRLAGAVQLRLDGAVSAATLVADRLVGMAGMAVMLPWGLGRFLSSGLSLGGAALPNAWSSAGAAAAPGGLGRLRSLLARVRAMGAGLLERFWQTFARWKRQPQGLAASFGFTLLYMLMKFTAIWLMLDGMGQPMPWMLVAGVWSLVYFITLLPVSINGYGLQEISVTLLYSSLGGISQEASVAIALLVRTMEMAASLPGALFVPGILAARKE